MCKCKHAVSLVRVRRSVWQKLSGIKEVYRCRECGEKTIVR
ncbi:hypothetical protein [Vibrio sp. SCSIO 43140]|nr:hypothetical protein [Vibrio sp. SCSIO 43140]